MYEFFPIASALISATAASLATVLPGGASPLVNQTVRIHNAGPSDVFIAFGPSTVTAAADGTSMIVPAGNTEVFRAGEVATYIATICPAAGTAAVYVTRGNGA
jgi:hypothetical protein